jgi:predicted MFS family arabinose efflux permease
MELRARFIWFFGLMLVHSLFYVPTISITNSIAFANLRNPSYEFPQVRLWGTIGWIAASVPFMFILVNWSGVPPLWDVGFADWWSAVFNPENSKQGKDYIVGVSYTYMAAGVASLILAAFSLALPHTPPKPALHGEGRLAWLKAMKLLSKPFVLVLFIATFIDAAVHAGYFMLTGPYLLNEVEIPAQWIMPVMSVGQVAEIGTMAILGFVLKSFGWRTTMVIGILGHTARFAIFGFFPEPLPAILVNTLHGICYAFFFATVYIFVDEFFPKDVRSSAQGLFNLLILGVGPFVGNFVWSALQAQYTFQVFASLDAGGALDGPVIYRLLFQAPALTALAAAVLLVLFFHPPPRAADVEVQR